MTEKALTVAEVAKYLNVSQNTVYRKASDGEIPGFRVGRAWRFFVSEIDAKRSEVADPWAAPSSKRRVA